MYIKKLILKLLIILRQQYLYTDMSLVETFIIIITLKFFLPKMTDGTIYNTILA